MKKLKKHLQKRSPKKILDIATGAGNYIHLITALYDDFSEIIGIDMNEGPVNSAEQQFDDARIRFRQMDGLQMDFPDNSFDLICLSNSLHHLNDTKAIMTEMERVLKPGGFMIINEMFCDLKDPKQLTHVHLHHFWAEVDRDRGVIHNETYPRKEILTLLSQDSSLELTDSWDMEYEEDPAGETDEQVQKIQKHLIGTLELTLNRAKDSPNLEHYQKSAEILTQRIKEVGFKSATQLAAILE